MKSKQENIFNFNHISESLNDQEVQELKAYYSTYHRKCWCYKQAYKKFRKWKIIADSTSVIFASSGLVSAIATSGISLVAISTTALLIQMYIKHKNIDMKIKSYQNAYKSYDHLLNDIKNSLRAGHFNRDNLTLKMTTFDKYERNYNNIFS